MLSNACLSEACAAQQTADVQEYHCVHALAVLLCEQLSIEPTPAAAFAAAAAAHANARTSVYALPRTSSCPNHPAASAASQ
jgi:hypothetical protein